MSNSNRKAFDDVKALNLSSKELLARFGRQALVAKEANIADPEVKAKVEELVEVITRDTREFTDQIQQIETKHAKWPAVPKRLSHYSQAMDVGGRYIGIIEDIHGVMGPAAVELTSILNDQIIAAEQQQQQV